MGEAATVAISGVRAATVLLRRVSTLRSRIVYTNQKIPTSHFLFRASPLTTFQVSRIAPSNSHQMAPPTPPKGSEGAGAAGSTANNGRGDGAGSSNQTNASQPSQLPQSSPVGDPLAQVSKNGPPEPHPAPASPGWHTLTIPSPERTRPCSSALSLCLSTPLTCCSRGLGPQGPC